MLSLRVRGPRLSPPSGLVRNRTLGSASARSFSATVQSSPPPPPAHIAAVRKGDIEGFLACSLLPPAARDSAFVMRALNLEVAGVKEGARGNIPAARLRMAFWREFVDAAFTAAAESAASGSPLSSQAASSVWKKSSVEKHPLFAPFVAAVASHGHTRRFVERLIDSRDAALDGPPPATVSDMDRYAEHTCASLLLLALEACGVSSSNTANSNSGVGKAEAQAAEEVASLLGRAIGLVNVVRAMPLHALRGERYVSDDLLSRFNLGHRDMIIPAGALGSANKDAAGGSSESRTQDIGKAARAALQAQAGGSSTVELYHRASGLPLRQWYENEQQKLHPDAPSASATAPASASEAASTPAKAHKPAQQAPLPASPVFAPKSIGGAQFEFEASASKPSASPSSSPPPPQPAQPKASGLLRMTGSPALLRQQQQQQQAKLPTVEAAKSELKAFSSSAPRSSSSSAPQPHVHGPSCNRGHGSHDDHAQSHDHSPSTSPSVQAEGPQVQIALSDIVIRRSPPRVEEAIRELTRHLLTRAEEDFIASARRLSCPFSLAFLPVVPAQIAARQIGMEGGYNAFSHGIGYWGVDESQLTGEASRRAFGVSAQDERDLASFVPSEAWRRGLRLALLKAAVQERF